MCGFVAANCARLRLCVWPECWLELYSDSYQGASTSAEIHCFSFPLALYFCCRFFFFLFEAISHISGQEEVLEWHTGEERRCEGGKKLFSHKGQVPIWKRQVWLYSSASALLAVPWWLNAAIWEGRTILKRFYRGGAAIKLVLWLKYRVQRSIYSVFYTYMYNEYQPYRDCVQMTLYR